MCMPLARSSPNSFQAWAPCCDCRPEISSSAVPDLLGSGMLTLPWKAGSARSFQSLGRGVPLDGFQASASADRPWATYDGPW